MEFSDSEKQISEVLRHLGFKNTEDSWVLKKGQSRCEISLLSNPQSLRVSWIDEATKMRDVHFFDLADGDASQNTEQWQSFVGWLGFYVNVESNKPLEGNSRRAKQEAHGATVSA